ncbi:hypothetical protein [Phyllobacterium salinisoli]|uniref:hypothetical protein n=1 Tax=Phyllobacterium salinisoli TaxID=1899321 RepID=UPI00135A7ABE|nr:hypothetical protein [Phyllobacterium salinisoli]
MAVGEQLERVVLVVLVVEPRNLEPPLGQRLEAVFGVDELVKPHGLPSVRPPD